MLQPVNRLFESDRNYAWPVKPSTRRGRTNMFRLERPPMPVTERDIAELQSELNWVRSSSRRVLPAIRIEHLTRALERAIAMLKEESKPQNNIGFWVLGAFHDSLRRSDKDGQAQYFITNLPQYNWACEQLEQLYGPMQKIDSYAAPPTDENHPHRRKDDG
jgi:hypothetical protein